jgi:hypothetical protein
MFALVAGLVFSIALLLAVGTILAMFALYHDKMVAALLFEPIPKEAPVYKLHIRRPRMAVVERRTMRSAPVRLALA